MSGPLLSVEVEALEELMREVAARLTLPQQLRLTVHLVSLRRAAGMPARLCGPAGRVLRLVSDDQGPEVA